MSDGLAGVEGTEFHIEITESMPRTTTTRCRSSPASGEVRGHRRRRQPLPGLPGRLFGAQLTPTRAWSPVPSSSSAPLTLTSRAFFNDQLGLRPGALRSSRAGDDAADELRRRGGRDRAQVSRKGATRSGRPQDQANIIVMEGNSPRPDDDDHLVLRRQGRARQLRPYTPGFRAVTYGDIEAVRAAVDEHTVAVLFEPIQGEGGVVIPPEGFLRDLRELCTQENVLMVADEIQSGLGRTGKTFACDHEGVVPDLYILGKALGGGLYPSARSAPTRTSWVSSRPGPTARPSAATRSPQRSGTRSSLMLLEGEFQERAARLGRDSKPA